LARDRLFECNSRLTSAARLIQNCERNKTMQRLQRFGLWVLQPKVGLPLALLLCLATSPFVYRATRLSGLPDCRHPFDVEAFGTQEVPDAENAFIEYRKAAKRFKRLPNDQADYESLDKALKEGWGEANTNVQTWVADNRACLAIWRRGTEKSDALNHQPKDVTFNTLLPVVDVARDFARSARLEGSRLEEAGDFDKAWSWYYAIFRNSRHFGMRGVFIERLVGISIHTMAAEATAKWARHDELTPQQLRLAITDLQVAYPLSAPASVAFKVEYLSLMHSIDRLPLLEYSDTPWELGETELFFNNEPEMGRRVIRQVFTNWLAEIDKPRHLRRPQVLGQLGLYERDPTITYDPASLPPEQIEEFAERSLFASSMLLFMPTTEKRFSDEQARQAALITMLALRLHQLETGNLPATLDDLVEAGILESVPIDPWHPTGKPLRYLRKGETVTVYSLGENGIDDGGNIERGIRGGRPDIGFDIQPVKSNNKP
jgi:hypothetical protein